MNFDWENLEKKLNFSVSSKTYEKDTRFWKMSRDENDNGMAIIRLLPDPKTTPFIKMFHYTLKRFDPVSKKTQWYIENSPETIGLPDPVKEHFNALIQEGTKEASDESKNFKRQTKFITNILVVKDPANPENDGKVFLWEFGTKLKDKFFSWMKPSEEELMLGTSPKPLYNPLSSYNIKLKAHKGSNGFVSYENSEIFGDAPTSVSKTVKDEASAIKYLQDNCYDLSDFLDPSYYKSYDELKSKFDNYLKGVKRTNNYDKPNSSKQSEDYESITGIKASQPTSSSQASSADEDDWLQDL